MSALTWQELGARSAARQFADVDGRDVDAVVAAFERFGPVQAQTARAPYVGLAARLPGVERDTITAAYEELRVVRGSNLRGTVHTSTPADHALMEVATRTAQRKAYERTWLLQRHDVADAWAVIEEYAAADWRTAQEVHDHVRAWLDAHDPGERPRVDETLGRSMSFGHGGLVRRPLTGGWESQGKAGYRSAAGLLGDRAGVLADVDGSLDALVRRHLHWHGPSSRQDVSWWSGLGLTVVDASLERLAGETVALEGPDGRTFHDLLDAPEPVELTDVRLLAEFDATLCAYDSKQRDRFVDPAHFARLWNKGNALINAPLMVDGRLTGEWRLEGSGAKRRLDVRWYPRTRRPRKAELEAPAAALAAAYGVTLSGVTLASAG